MNSEEHLATQLQAIAESIARDAAVRVEEAPPHLAVATESKSSEADVVTATDKAVELGLQYCKLAVQEMPTTPLMAYNVFTTMDTTYFTGYPSIDDPYTDPVPNWGNTKYMFVKIKPKEA